ncbi:Mobile element protein [[Actinomadura] parvosata subsp. kistnae]|uniref:Transposase n=1 Tax=[Actinomadura] parvosata subsp. kistnae TaxID=1909395 RepID=A0A1U9ZYF2_9ACTN|nr:hypothetical protein BKM31_17270 [Nonomuraea sp. ATCC 55076]SPL98624.1 Mobile element protein [Actinomadura parvosata subsp. kistnae]
MAMAVTVDGERDILGLWAGDGGEGAKFWLHVLTETTIHPAAVPPRHPAPREDAEADAIAVRHALPRPG